MDDLLSLSETPENNDEAIDEWLELRSLQLADLIAEELLRITTEAYEQFIASVDETTVAASGDLYSIDSIPAKWDVVAQQRVIPNITQTYLTGSLFAYNVASDKQQIPQSVAAGWANVVNQQAVDYALTASNRLRDVGNTVWNDIRKKVSKSIEQGNSTEQLKTDLEQLGLFSEYRADTIARTETSSAYLNGNWNSDQALGQFGPIEKMWSSAGDARTRPSHFNVGQTSRANPVPFNEPFDVGGIQMMFPHSPGAPAKEVVNCRCKYQTLYIGDERPDGTIVTAPAQAVTPVQTQESTSELYESKLGSEDFTPDAWTPIDQSMYADVIDRFVPETTGKVAMAQRAELRVALQQSSRKLINGDILVLDSSTLGQADFDVCIELLQDLRLGNKQSGKGVVVNFYDQIPNQDSRVLADATLAYSEKSLQQLRFSKNATSGFQPINNATNRGFYQTSNRDVSVREYTFAHEWGHIIDKLNTTPNPGRRQTSEYQKNYTRLFNENQATLSIYGKTNFAEAFAETFGDYWTSNGKSKNTATQEYAKLFNWNKP